LLGLFLDPEDGCNMFFPNAGSFNRPHSGISQKIELFITDAMTESLP
jgi:hypothetical protein